MAEILVGSAFLSAFLEVVFNRLASRQVLDFFHGRKLDEKLLNKLKVKLRSINAVVDDAELKQIENQLVRDWLFDVKDAVHDAEDLLDEIDYELSKYQVEDESESQTFTHKVSNLFNVTFSSLNRKIDSGMKQVLEKLEDLVNQKDDLGLKEVTYSGVGSGNKVPLKLESTSLVVESFFYGRDDEKEMIFDWLTSEIDSHNQLSIFSIVGMGGVGKTTLAQHVYNDPRMEETKFDIKAWVCVSDDFDVLTVTRTILEAFTGLKYDNGKLEMVHRRLKIELTGKKFLLVLDDVWNERRENWEVLQTPLNFGAPGSRILVTTRSEKVASAMRSHKVYHLKQLQEEHSWQVFAKHAFLDGYPQLNDEMKEIGALIVKKCKGLPLALKSIGSLLHKKSISEWESVSLSKIWDLRKEDSEIIPALFLSYHHLPSHLKRCFAYCALFPKDYKFDKEGLIQLWMAENFLQCLQESKSPEEVGEQYFDDLLSRSFFQRSSKSEIFVMHDLLNDLAKYACGDICFRLGIDKAESIPKTTRHFSFGFNDLRSFDWFESSYYAAKRLHTFILMQEVGFFFFDWGCMISIHDLFSRFKSLRILSLSHCFNLRDVPDSLGKLKHLRSLDLSSTDIKKLPNSTCLLYNLQILKLNNCLSLEELPTKLHNLTNLRRLEFANTQVQKTPKHLGRLKNLQVLSSFCVGKSSDLSIKQLGGLNLHGGLSIEELQNIVDPSDALAVNFKNKTHLVELKLEWNSNRIPDDPKKEKEIVQNLQPSKHLKDLSIYSYGGTQFPSWLSNVNVVSLRLVHCKYCLVLPPFGVLPFLNKLTIIGLDGIVSIGAEFYGSSSSSFPSLETLQFLDMKEWEEWECQAAAFPLSNTSLEVLRIYDCPNMNIPMRCCYDFLVTLVISASHSLTTFPLEVFPKLHSLELWHCCNFQIISQEHTCNNLKNLKINDCPKFESFPSEGLSAPLLAKLSIWKSKNLKLLPKRMHTLLPSLTELEIDDCPEVKMFSDGGLPSNLKRMDLLNCSKLIASLKGSLGANTSLEILSIQKVDVESFPDEGFLPLSLTSLQIHECPDLKKLNYKGLSHLSSLKELNIYFCPNLQCLPKEGLPISISTLQILYCPLLKQRCQKPEGEDWEKIALIKNRNIF
uniref:Disease resistance RPP13-like protein 1 n=1 Tax=Cajanus cajan TaxID=3821 RepID=A0A151RYU1_CAJCA|nr:Putative disease resistance RPP13-like protein 1 [Cajanus cajan]